MADRFYHGGQAIIEGVMMRGQENLAMAVRKPDGELDVVSQKLPRIYTGPLRKLLFVRGAIVLVETMTLGVKALMHSAKIAAREEEEEISGCALWGAVSFSLIFAVALFFVLPLLAARYLFDQYVSALASNLIEGGIRIGLFVAYLRVINLIPEIKRVFAYHGAEHKAVNALEAGEALELETARKYSTAHTRCGTSFLLVVLVIAIVVFALLGRPSLWVSILSRIVLIPVIAALGYEAVRFSARHANNRLVRLLLAPGLALQSLTTREPDDGQLETALVALKRVVEADAARTAA